MRNKVENSLSSGYVAASNLTSPCRQQIPGQYYAKGPGFAQFVHSVEAASRHAPELQIRLSKGGAAQHEALLRGVPADVPQAENQDFSRSSSEVQFVYIMRPAVYSVEEKPKPPEP